MSFSDRVTKSRDHLLRLVTGKSGGQDAWWYIRVKSQLFEKYKFAVKSTSIDLKNYGEIVLSGWGQMPPADVVKKMEEN